MYCPKCRAEYREGFDTCFDCETALVQELPTKEKQSKSEVIAEGKAKPVGTYATHAEAEIVAGFLRSNGIEAIVSSSGYKAWAPYGSSFKKGIPVIVLEGDLARSQELIESMPYEEGTTD